MGEQVGIKQSLETLVGVAGASTHLAIGKPPRSRSQNFLHESAVFFGSDNIKHLANIAGEQSN